MISDAASPAGQKPAAELLLKLSFRSSPDRLKLARAGVRAAAQCCGFDPVAIDDIVLAVDEACANVIVHVYGNEPDGNIDLKILRAEDSIRVCIRDYGAPVENLEFKPRDLDDLTPGGLGTHFIAEIMDHVHHRPAPDGSGNILELTKRFSEAA